jgi:hypothetical protein
MPEDNGTLGKKIRDTLIGKPRNIKDPSLFHKLALIPLLAWIGLGADGVALGNFRIYRSSGVPQRTVETATKKLANLRRLAQDHFGFNPLEEQGVMLFADTPEDVATFSDYRGTIEEKVNGIVQDTLCALLGGCVRAREIADADNVPVALLGEINYNIFSLTNIILSARLDKNDYSKSLFSFEIRVGFVVTPSITPIS